MHVRYVGPFTCWLPDAPQVGNIAPGAVVDVPDTLVPGLLAQPSNWQPVADVPVADAAESEPSDDAPPATRKRSSR